LTLCLIDTALLRETHGLCSVGFRFAGL